LKHDSLVYADLNELIKLQYKTGGFRLLDWVRGFNYNNFNGFMERLDSFILRLGKWRTARP